MGVQSNLLGWRDDVGEDADGALVGEITTQLDIVDGNVIVDCLDIFRENVPVQYI